MVGSMAKDIYSSLASALNEGWSVGIKGGRTNVIVMAIANEMCG
jgi:hypothetical protein